MDAVLILLCIFLMGYLLYQHLRNRKPTVEIHGVTCPSSGQDIPVLLTNVEGSADIVRDFLRYLDGCPVHERVIGIDGEWVSTPSDAEAPSPIALLQLASVSQVILIRLTPFRRGSGAGAAQGVPQSLKELLGRSDIVKVGVSVKEDATRLCVHLCLPVRGCLDIARLPLMSQSYEEHRRPGLIALAREHWGVSLEKDPKVARSNWEADTLSASQIHYATLDAWAALHTFRAQRKHLLLQHQQLYQHQHQHQSVEVTPYGRPGMAEKNVGLSCEEDKLRRRRLCYDTTGGSGGIRGDGSGSGGSGARGGSGGSGG
eukprot:Rmarinus@m.28187